MSDKLYSSLTHSDPLKIRNRMIDFLKENGVAAVNGAYRLDLGQCESYLSQIFSNLPTRTIKHMVDQIILLGGFTTERNADGRWVVVIADNSRPISYQEKKTEFSKKKELRKFLLDMKASGQKIDLVNFTYFCRLLTGALAEDKRWKMYTKMCKERKLSANGEALPETILEHTGIDTPLLGGMMLARERQARTRLHYDLLQLAFTLHDLPEGVALKGDVDFNLKGKEVDNEEDDAFGLMMAVFSPEVAVYFEKAYAIVRESGQVKRAGVPIEQVSLDAQFFMAVEIAGYLSRALYEVKAGNIVFGNTFWNHHQFESYFLKRFVSFGELIGSHILFMDEFRSKHQDSDWQKELEKDKKS